MEAGPEFEPWSPDHGHPYGSAGHPGPAPPAVHNGPRGITGSDGRRRYHAPPPVPAAPVERRPTRRSRSPVKLRRTKSRHSLTVKCPQTAVADPAAPATNEQGDDVEEPRKLFVSHLNLDTTREEICDTFGKHGEISVLVFPERNYAFVTFTTSDAASRIMDRVLLHRKLFHVGNAVVSVTRARPTRGKRRGFKTA